MEWTLLEYWWQLPLEPPSSVAEPGLVLIAATTASTALVAEASAAASFEVVPSSSWPELEASFRRTPCRFC